MNADDVLRAVGAGPIVFLTGAGISAESGIPTFRGPEGYWTIGSRNFHPTEMATRRAFAEMPEEVWAWYLFRRSVCRAAAPNAAHLALAELEAKLGDRFRLVTQNVDGLHLRAGNTLARTWQIHGNVDYLRCFDECPAVAPMPTALPVAWPKERRLGDAERAALKCASCAGWTRPHVLWFDESYDEERFRFRSSIEAAREAAMLVVVGTSGATNLPSQMCDIVAARGAPFLVIGPEPTPFTELAEASACGSFLRGTAVEHVPAVAAALSRA